MQVSRATQGKSPGSPAVPPRPPRSSVLILLTCNEIQGRPRSRVVVARRLGVAEDVVVVVVLA